MTASKNKWLNKNVLFISLNAFFTDLGHQAILAIFPIFLVLYLRLSVIEYAVITAISFGGGSFFGYVGGKAGDRFGYKKTAVLSNLFVPLLSLLGLSINVFEVASLFSVGWWARCFRNPARRVMLLKSILKKEYYGRAFGFLHFLDIGGAFLSALTVAILLSFKFPIRTIFIFTAIPIIIAIIFLYLSNPIEMQEVSDKENAVSESSIEHLNKNIYYKVLIATSLYGFSAYSFGFPIITIAIASKDNVLGVASYVVFLAVSSVTGLFAGKVIAKSVGELALGYILGGIGSLGIGLTFAFNLNADFYFPSVVLSGVSMGFIETLEPTIIGFISSERKTGKSMGSLSAMRSLGIFVANIIMGLLYLIGAGYSFAYAGILSLIAGFIIFGSKLII